MERISHEEGVISVLDVTRLLTQQKDNRNLLDRACQAEALPKELKRVFQNRLSHP